jgi:integrase/recombinase XerD
MVLPFRKRYLRQYKNDSDDSVRKLLNIEEMATLVGSIMDPRDKAIALMLAKTGIRRGEMLKLDVDSIDWLDYSVTLKPTPKRSNRTVFFDDECAMALKRWLRVREKLCPNTNALFVSYQSLNRFDRNGLCTAMVEYARSLGLCDCESSRLEDHFSPHCFRHWFATWLLRNGMSGEYVSARYIDREELRRSYLAYVPKLGV